MKKRNSCCRRLVSDFRIIKDSFKLTVVWRIYLFWLLSGLKPTFSGLQYYQIKDVYNISEAEYGNLGVISAFAILFGVIVY